MSRYLFLLVPRKVLKNSKNTRIQLTYIQEVSSYIAAKLLKDNRIAFPTKHDKQNDIVYATNKTTLSFQPFRSG